MKNAGIIAIVAICIVAAGAGIYFMTRKPKDGKTDKPVTKDDVLALLTESEKEHYQANGILDKMSAQELTDTYILITATPEMEAGKLTSEELFKKYPGLKDRLDAISKKYNIFT